MDEMPDLSHLTEEERKIIEKVILRQKQEEEREHEIMRKKQDEVHVLEQTIRQRSEQQKKAGVELDATCHICLKTKFADGVGHICNYCNIRCCARCGGKVTLRSNKVIWVCILCRKKQELLSKTGQWINKGIFTSQDTIMSKIQADLNQQQFPGAEEGIQQSLNNDKRPKLERALSAVEKENLPLQRSGSQLRRQYSQQEQSTKTSDQSQYEEYSKYTEEDPRYYRAEIDDLMRSAPYYDQTSQSSPYRDDKGDYEKSHLYPEVSGVRSGDYRAAPEQPRSVNFANGSGSGKKTVSGVQFGSTTRQPQRSFSSSEDDLRSTPDFASYGDPDRAGGMDPEGDADNLVRKHHGTNHVEEKDQVEFGQYDNPEPNESVYSSHNNKEVRENGSSKENNCYDEECGDASSAVNGGRRHSISSDFHSEYGRAYQKRNGMKRGSEKDKNYIKQAWYESIRDRYQSTNRGFKKDIVFPKSLDNYRTKCNEIKNTIIRTGNKLWEEGDKRRLTERRKKTVRFDGGHESNSFDDGWMTLDNIDRWDSLRQGSQDSGTKDSGIETSSNFTSSEDSNKGDFFKYPMSWHLNQDGTHLIGHMILNRSREPADSSNIAPIIGLKVDGNRILENGRRGALIEKVKEGSIADIEGGLRPGDEIIEWNGRMFRGASNQEVANVIAQSKHETQVELVVSRPVKPIKKVPGSSGYRRGSTFASPTSSPQQKAMPYNLPSATDYVGKDESVYFTRTQGLRVRYPWTTNGEKRRITNQGKETSSTVPTENDPSLVLPLPRPWFLFPEQPVPKEKQLQRYKCKEDESKNDFIKISDSYEYKMREKPSVRITSPGSPDVHSTGPSRIRYSSAANANVGGRIEIKVLHDAAVDELVIIVTCAVGLVPKSNGQPRNPYAKVFLLPDRGEKSKRRTRTVANTNDPKWNQSFIFCGVKRTDLKTKSAEISVWDYAQVGTNDFLGETLIDIGSCTLGHDTWYHLGPHEEFLCYRRREGEMELDMTPTDHLSPPSTMSRFSDSETSDYDETKERRITDGASLSSIGSSGSPPPEVEMSDRRSRRDMSPQGRKRTAVMMSRDRMLPYQAYKYIGQGIMSQRSHSAAPTESPSLRQNGRTRSQSPKRVGSLSPPDPRKYPSHTYVPRLTSRSATVTPTGSPKKRHLPQIPSLQSRKGTRETTNQDFDERAQYIKQKLASMQRRHGGTTGWDRQFGGLSDSDLPTNETKLRMRDWFSPEKEFGDSDMESVVSITSSAFSTQSERPRGLRDYGAPTGGGTAERGGRITQTLDRPVDRKAQGVTKTEQATRSLSGAEAAAKDKDVTASGTSGTTTAAATATTTQVTEKQEQRKSTVEKPTKSSTPIPFISGMGKKSNSTSQLSATDATSKKKSGGKQSSRRVHRSVEVVPPVSQQSLGSGSDNWYHSLKSSEYSHLSDFIEGLGPGQLVGRQVLGSSSLGDVQLSLRFQKGQLEVEVVRARGLRARPGSKVLPAPYVKVYLVCGKKCVAKSKTAAARRTLDPLYQTPMTFKDIHSGCILQVTVWGDYGRIEGKKVFMGVAQIMLDDLDLSNLVIGWYKLFGTTSLVSGPPSLGLSRRSSLASLDSLKIL